MSRIPWLNFRGWPLAIVAVTLFVSAILAACSRGGGDDDDTPSDDAAFDSYARSVCFAIDRLVDTVQPKITPSAGPPRDAMIAAWQTFIEDLDKAVPPSEAREYHDEWVKMQKDDLAAYRSGKPTYQDPLDHAPEAPQALETRLSAAFQRTPECKLEQPSPAATPTRPAAGPSPTQAALPTPAPAIDHSSPAKYREPGSQSKLTDANAATVKAEIGSGAQGLPLVGAIAKWLRASFTTVPNNGATIGTTDVNTLIASRTLTGCHDSALVFSTVLRLYGVPAIMADSAGIQWAEDFRAGKATGDLGHVFVEAHVEGRWLLIECGSARYAQGYDSSNPVITLPGMPDAKGFYVIAKGVDPAGYGVGSGSVLHQRFVAFANALPSLTLNFPNYSWQALPE